MIDTKEFDEFAGMLMKLNPPIRALQYADADTRVIYVYPPKNNEITISDPMILLADSIRKPFVKKAIDQRKATIQGPFILRQGGTGVVVRFPIYKEGRFIGLTIGVYDVPVLVKEALEGIDLNRFVFRLTDRQGRIFWGPENITHSSAQLYIPAADTEWSMTLSWIAEPISPPVVLGKTPLWKIISRRFTLPASVQRSS